MMVSHNFLVKIKRVTKADANGSLLLRRYLNFAAVFFCN